MFAHIDLSLFRNLVALFVAIFFHVSTLYFQLYAFRGERTCYVCYVCAQKIFFVLNIVRRHVRKLAKASSFSLFYYPIPVFASSHFLALLSRISIFMLSRTFFLLLISRFLAFRVLIFFSPPFSSLLKKYFQILFYSPFFFSL